MKIVQVSPGIIDIPPKGWGAIETVIWNYKLSIEKQGHVCDIKMLDDINPDEYDIIHIHVANLANLAYERKIPYVFSLHDHHVELVPNIFDENKRAIDNSILSLTHALHYFDLFDNHPKMCHLPHGVDITKFNIDNKSPFLSHRLLCVGNNVLLNTSPEHDRKGFAYAIKSAEQLNTPIMCCGPRDNNETFFDNNKDLSNYPLLSKVYDLTKEELYQAYNSATIFVHPSEVEAGHPNLTLLEAMASGLPVVGTFKGDPLPGMVIVDRDVESITEGIKKIKQNYSKYQEDALNTAQKHSWDIIIEFLLYLYGHAGKHDMRDDIFDVYDNIEKRSPNIRKISNEIELSFLDGVKCEITGKQQKKYKIDFYDDDTDKLIYSTNINTNEWASPNLKYYVNWKICINDSTTYFLKLKKERVLISLESSSLGDTLAWVPIVEEFRKYFKCEVVITTFWNDLFLDTYPELDFQEPGIKLDNIYAWYRVGCFDNDYNRNKKHWQLSTLQSIAVDILGLPISFHRNITAKIKYHDKERPIKQKYVAISEHSTMQAKYWNCPDAWQVVVDYLGKLGYGVLVISKEPTKLINCIDKTDSTIGETINNIKHAEFYIGVSSGPAWLAWSLGVESIIISGCTEEWLEFSSSHRIINTNVCHGCLNDIRIHFDRGTWNWCPYSKDFECTRSIKPQTVTDVIDKIIESKDT